MKKTKSNNVTNGTSEKSVTLLAGEMPSPEPVKNSTPSYEELFELKLYRGYCEGYSNKTIVVEIQAKMYQQGDSILIPQVKLLESLTNESVRGEVFKAIMIYYPLREIHLSSIIKKAEELFLEGKYTENNDLDNIKLPNTLQSNEAELYIKDLVQYLKEYEEEFVKCSSNEFDPDSHYGVYLDTPAYKEKYGKNAIALTPEFLRTKIFIKGGLDEEGKGQQISTNFRREIDNVLIEKGILKPYSSTRRDWDIYYREDKSLKKKKAYVFSVDKLTSKE